MAKHTNKFKQKTVYVIDYNALESLIYDVYGIKYSFLCEEEARNDTVIQFHVFEEEENSWDASKLRKFKEGSHIPYITTTLLNDMCNNKLIDAGLYIVSVSW